MTTTQPEQRTQQVFRSMKEFKQRYLPNSYEKELLQEQRKDPKSFGASLARKHLEQIRRELQGEN